MRKNRICLNAVSRKIPDSLSEDRLMFSSAEAQPISLKSFRGLGHFPNKIARVYKHEHCLLSAFRSWQVMRSGYRRALLAGMASSRCGYSPDLLAILQENPGRTTPVFASVATLAVLALPLIIALTRTFVLVIIRPRD